MAMATATAAWEERPAMATAMATTTTATATREERLGTVTAMAMAIANASRVRLAPANARAVPSFARTLASRNKHAAPRQTVRKTRLATHRTNALVARGFVTATEPASVRARAVKIPTVKVLQAAKVAVAPARMAMLATSVTFNSSASASLAGKAAAPHMA